MPLAEIVVTRELACHFNDIEKLHASAFGPGRFSRTAFRLREGTTHASDLSFVSLKGKRVVGSIRMTRIIIGARMALLLGPLAVDPSHGNRGIGGKLMKTALSVCKNTDVELIILVGDKPYYRPFGFKPAPRGKIILSGPVDPARLLYLELKKGALKNFSGLAKACSHGSGAIEESPAS